MFLDEDNSVKLGDFGLSKMIRAQDFASTYVGTPFYMSPEIIAGEKYTLKSDIWAMGCIIYELCSREPPFNGRSHPELNKKIALGKFAPLPDCYSPELYSAIKKCMLRNADERPDTIELLNIPAVKLMRKELEVSMTHKKLKVREDSMRRKEKEIDARLARMEQERALVREEIDSSVRREWEVKARLEIDLHIQKETERLRQQFEEELQLRVEAAMSKKAVAFADPEPKSDPFESSTANKSDYPHSSIGTSGEDLSSTTDLTDYSIDSPEPAVEKEPKKTARTPFGRAQTMFAGAAGTPMDIEMASPSPIAIASLSLSPRRAGAGKAPSVPEGNIFGAKNGDTKWAMRDEPVLEESDDEDIIPSPTRNVKSSKNPFTAKNRPVLTSQKTAPVNGIPKTGGLTSKLGQPQAQSELSPRSPNRRLSKIPSAANLQGETSISSFAARKAKMVKSSEPTGSVLGNNIKGRTLVELQQARAGGRPVSAISAPTVDRENLANTSPKRRAATERRASGGSGTEPAIWDPETDEMPSPFLVRHRKITRA